MIMISWTGEPEWNGGGMTAGEKDCNELSRDEMWRMLIEVGMWFRKYDSIDAHRNELSAIFKEQARWLSVVVIGDRREANVGERLKSDRFDETDIGALYIRDNDVCSMSFRCK